MGVVSVGVTKAAMLIRTIILKSIRHIGLEILEDAIKIHSETAKFK